MSNYEDKFSEYDEEEFGNIEELAEDKFPPDNDYMATITEIILKNSKFNFAQPAYIFQMVVVDNGFEYKFRKQYHFGYKGKEITAEDGTIRYSGANIQEKILKSDIKKLLVSDTPKKISEQMKLFKDLINTYVPVKIETKSSFKNVSFTGEALVSEFKTGAEEVIDLSIMPENNQTPPSQTYAKPAHSKSTEKQSKNNYTGYDDVPF